MKHKNLMQSLNEVKAKEGPVVQESVDEAVIAPETPAHVRVKVTRGYIEKAKQAKQAGDIKAAKKHLARAKAAMATEEVGSEEKEAVKKPIMTDLDSPDDVKKIKRGPEGKTEDQQIKQPLIRESSKAAGIIQSYLDDEEMSLTDFQHKFNKHLKMSKYSVTVPSLDKYVDILVRTVFKGD